MDRVRANRAAPLPFFPWVDGPVPPPPLLKNTFVFRASEFVAAAAAVFCPSSLSVEVGGGFFG